MPCPRDLPSYKLTLAKLVKMRLLIFEVKIMAYCLLTHLFVGEQYFCKQNEKYVRIQLSPFRMSRIRVLMSLRMTGLQP